jgi:hypothetical protein
MGRYHKHARGEPTPNFRERRLGEVRTTRLRLRRFKAPRAVPVQQDAEREAVRGFAVLHRRRHRRAQPLAAIRPATAGRDGRRDGSVSRSGRPGDRGRRPGRPCPARGLYLPRPTRGVLPAVVGPRAVAWRGQNPSPAPSRRRAAVGLEETLGPPRYVQPSASASPKPVQPKLQILAVYRICDAMRGAEARACYELGRKSHRNTVSTVGPTPSQSPFPAFLCRF